MIGSLERRVNTGSGSACVSFAGVVSSGVVSDDVVSEVASEDSVSETELDSESLALSVVAFVLLASVVADVVARVGAAVVDVVSLAQPVIVKSEMTVASAIHAARFFLNLFIT